MIGCMARAPTHTWMEQSTWVIGAKISITGRERKRGQMAQSTTETSHTVRRKVMEFSSGKTVALTMAHSSRIAWKARARTFGPMVGRIQANGRTIVCMEEESSSSKMDEST